MKPPMVKSTTTPPSHNVRSSRLRKSIANLLERAPGKLRLATSPGRGAVASSIGHAMAARLPQAHAAGPFRIQPGPPVPRRRPARKRPEPGQGVAGGPPEPGCYTRAPLAGGGGPMTDALIVFTTFGNEEEAARAVRVLVEERLAGCGALRAGARAIYPCKGSSEERRE